MPSAPVDLRSDTVTRPDAAMRRAMERAPLGDDVFGDDPTVRALEERAADLTGKEAALFTPSGTQANQVAVALHARPGDEAILEADAHTFHFEVAGAAWLWGVQLRPLPGEGGQVPLGAVEAAIRPADDIHCPRTRLLVLEETANLAGGRILPLAYLRDAGSLCRRRGLRFHLDGARIFNASVASGVPVRDLAAPADSVMFCVSKGLGAPAGSLLCGPGGFIDEGRRVRKLLGGGMRQAGVLAACGLHALEANVAALAEDHRRAAELAAELAPLGERGLEVQPPETSMVYLSWRGATADDYRAFTARLAERGVLTVPLGAHGVRIVFHRDVGDAAALRARGLVREALEETLG